MAKRAGPKTRRMSPGRRAVSRLERLKDLSARVSTGRVGDVTLPSVDPGATQIGQPIPDSTSSRRDAPGVPFQPNLAPVYLPARMINEFVYCPRLFYYEQVEGVFLDNADTIRGSQGHKRVDQGSGALSSSAKASKDKPTAASADPNQAKASEDLSPFGKPSEDKIHARSVELASDRLGVVCKMDLVEVRTDLFSSVQVCPVEYKAGTPREGDDGIELWDTDKVQLVLQCLILRDNGYDCKEGILYYRSTKQRVRLEITPEIETWAIEIIARARTCAEGERPAPLVASPKCVRCSLAPVCLPDETNFLRQLDPDTDPSAKAEEDNRFNFTGRRSLAQRDERRALYLNSPGLSVGRKGEVLEIREKKTVLQEVRIRDINHLGIFGNIQISTQVVQELCEQEVPITFFSGGGWFYGITHGLGLTNVFTRIAQFAVAGEARYCLVFARSFVAGKIRNQRTMLMRNHEEPPTRLLNRLRQAVNDALLAKSLDELLGIEGAAAANYFGAFAGMLKPEPNDALTFDFRSRNRRPPRDPVNALLSLGYSLLAKDCSIAAAAVGFDPYVGFYHQPRFGRPALALDIMEEFRPLIADSVAVTLVNNRMLDESHFVRAGNATNLTARGRKIFFEAYEARLTSVVTHPVFDYKVCYRRAIELQFRLLARVLTGEIAIYRPFVTR
jgi:CRISPR-associated protein Cas1